MEENFNTGYPGYDNGFNQSPFPPQGPNYVQRQVSFGEAVKRAFQNYCNFEGRASRSEYWWFALFTMIIVFPFSFASGFMQGLTGSDDPNVFTFICGIIELALFLPSLGLAVRRLHDIGKSGWWWLLSFACCIGPIVLIIWFIKESDPVENEYGPVPNIEQL